jgi:hypothetical protein
MDKEQTISSENSKVDELKQFPSIFCPSIKVNKANYLTEVMVSNLCKLRKRPLPSSPFWRKGIACNDPFLTELAKHYSIEVAGSRRLLKKYALSVLLKYYKDSCMPGFILLRKETKVKITTELDSRQAEFDLNKRIQVAVKVEDNIFLGVAQTTRKNVLSEL